MKKSLGEVFYEGRIINLNNVQDDEIKELLNKVRIKKVNIKENIELLLDKMMKV